MNARARASVEGEARPVMQPQPPPYDPVALEAFVALPGDRLWASRMAEIGRRAATGPRAGQAVRLRHGLELAIDRLRGPLARVPTTAELHAARLAGDAVALSRTLNARGRTRLRKRLGCALAGDGTLLPLFHVLRTAALQASRGFTVAFPGLAEAAPYDLLIGRGALEAEIACEVVSAEEGRQVHRRAWSCLADQVDDDLRAWLSAYPGRYLLRMTLPQGLDSNALTAMHDRIRRLLATRGRRDDDSAAVLRLDPLALAGDTLMPSLRREFGPEAHLAVTAAGASVFAMAARAGRTDEVAAAVRRRLFDIAPTRLSGTRPGILAMFIDDTDRSEWQGLRERLELEGEARQFLAYKAARQVIAVTCASRFELFGTPDAAAEGELRFRNPAHPSAKAVALEPAILSSV
jgi:hypothetical protein